MERVVHVHVNALLHGGGKAGTVNDYSGGSAGIGDVYLLALIDVDIVIDGLGEEGVVGKEAFNDGPLPYFFLYCHS